MRYELRLTAFDVMDQVWVTVTVQSGADAAERPIELVLARSTQAQGKGTTEATAWTREALEAMLRAL